MHVAEQITNVLEAAVRGSLAVIVNRSLNVLKEIFKFILILLIVYYFAMWTFQFLDDIFEKDHSPSILPLSHKELKKETDLIAYQIAGETCLRIGPPDTNLINKSASLLDQLEIEAEFEENQEKLATDLDNKNIYSASLKTKDSDEMSLYQFVSQIKQELNETSRASQTIKTSLGKKSKLREQRRDNGPATSHQDQDKFDANKILEIKREVLSDQDSSTLTKTISNRNKTNEEKPSFDDQYDHESFHRV